MLEHSGRSHHRLRPFSFAPNSANRNGKGGQLRLDSTSSILCGVRNASYTAVYAGVDLAGGGETGSVTLSADTAYLQRRVEIRECWSTSDPECLNYIGTLAEWRDLQSIAMIQTERQLGDQTTVSRRYFISSLKSDAEQLLKAVREHWGIENKVHWVLDIAFREDDCRIRKGHGAENFAVLRHIALNLLRRETSAKSSIKGKRMKAALDEKYLFKVLTGYMR